MAPALHLVDLVGFIARRIVASGWNHWRHPDRPRHCQLYGPGHRQREHHRHAAIEHCGRAGAPERLHDIPGRRHCGHALLAGLVREWWHRQLHLVRLRRARLPAGFSLAAGTIGGTPTAPGTASFTVQVTDSANTTATQPLSIAVAPAALNISTSSLPGGTVGASYSQGLSASGGTGSYTWSVSTGSLPAGLSLATTGTISGTPTASGTASFTVQVTDSANTSTTKPLSIAVAPAALNITTSSLPGGTVGTPYSQGLSASGGTGSYTWSVSSGSLPAGLSLAGGTIGGTPTAPGTASFTVQVTDSANTSTTKPLSIAVAPAALNITTSSLPGGTVGAPYSQGLSATGGTGSYTWSVSSGSLPAGLSLAGGTIGGTPTAPGTASFTVQVTDSANTTATQPLSIAVAPAALNISTSSLPGGTVGTPYSQGLSASGGTGSYTWSVTSGSCPPGSR